MAQTAGRPLRILLASVGSRGDVQPMMALAQTLAARGHVPVVAAPPNFESWVRSQGFEFAPLGSDVQAFLAANTGVLTGNPFTGLGVISRYFASEVPMWAQQAVQAGRGADAVLWSGLAVVMPSVAEHLGVPAVGVLYSSGLIPSAAHPPPIIARHGMPGWVNGLLWKLNRLVAQWLMGRPVNVARAALGLPSVTLHEHIWDGGQFVLAMDELLFPSDPAWTPGRFPYANYIFFDDPAPPVGPGWANRTCRPGGAWCAMHRTRCCFRGWRRWCITAAPARWRKCCVPACHR